MKTGVRQSWLLSPLLFNCFISSIVREAMEMTGGGLHVERTTSQGLLCLQGQGPIDHLHPECPVCGRPVAENRKKLHQILDALDRACTRWGMRISGDKTKVLSIGDPPGPAIIPKGQALEEVDSSYLGSEVEQTSRAKKDQS